MVRRKQNLLELDLWCLGDMLSGRELNNVTHKKQTIIGRLIAEGAGALCNGRADYTPNYFPKPRMNKLTLAVRKLDQEYQAYFVLRYVGVESKAGYTPLQINEIAIQMKCSQRKVISRIGQLKAEIKSRIPAYA